MTATEPKACVIGWPVDHSLSPLIHRHWLKRYALKGDYDRLAVSPEEIAGFLGAFADQGLVGCNVTLPHKETAFRLACRTSHLARRLGAANTLWLEDGELVADNTDTHGFLANLDEMAAGWDNAETALVIGAGGAARAIIAGLIDRRFRKVILANRTPERASALAQWFGADETVHMSAIPLDDLNAALSGADLIVNTTSAGLGGSPLLDVDWSSVSRAAIATDILYVPLITPFLSGAAEAGLTIVDGLGMLLHQAVPGFHKWFGVMPEVDDALRRRLLAALDGGD